MKKNTKRSLLFSVLALILCCALLAGTTLAWFTDSASSGVNKIQAGNLDIEVQYKKAGAASFESIEGTQTLFSGELWEPGHTEYVYLKVHNAGSLALKYQVLVSPVTENGGINVNNENFKLSDYLVFGTTAAAPTCPDYQTREAARAAVGETRKLNQVNLKKYSEILPEGDDDYIALVVYMPETVDNVANAKPGTTPPSINLGITVVATQMENENDSFGSDYDEGAVNDSKYNIGSAYNYFPQSMASGAVTKDESNSVASETTIKATGKLNQTDATETTLAQVTIPVGVKLKDDTDTLTLKVVPAAATNTEAQNVITVETAAGREVANFDIKVDGVADDNNTEIPVEVFVGKGLNNVTVYHNGEEISSTYNSATGYVSFSTKRFSDFTVAFDAIEAAIGSETYGTVANAFAAVKSSETITLLKNAKGNGIVVSSGSNFTVNFNGFSYDIDGTTVGSTGTETNGFQLLEDSTITFKNGSLTSEKAKILIQNYSNLTLDNMKVSAGSQCGYVVSNNNGDVTIKDTTITAASGKVAFDVCRYSSYIGPEVTVEGNSVINGDVEISSSGAKEGATHKLNVTGGTFNGAFKLSSSPNFVGNITGGTFSTDPTEYLAKGGYYTVVNGKYVVDVIEGADLVITDKAGLVAFANSVNNKGMSYAGETVALACDIDLSGTEWTPVGQTGATQFLGTFDGMGHTIKNLTVNNIDESAHCSSGLFGWLNSATVKNVKVDGANVSGHHNVGVIAGYLETSGCTIENCHVTNANISCTSVNDNANGDKCGGIVGHAGNAGVSVKNCTVTNSSISAGRDAGQVVGAAKVANVTGCSATNVTVTANDTSSGAYIREEVIGRIL